MENKVLDFEKVIIKSIYTKENVCSKVMPYLSADWFMNNQAMINITHGLTDYYNKYSKLPTPTEMGRVLNQKEHYDYFLEGYNAPESEVTEFILEDIEQFVRLKLKYNIAADVIKSCGTPNAPMDSDFAQRMSDAESFTFDDGIGLDFMKDMGKIREEAVKNEILIKTGMTTLDEMLNGGFHEKSLSLILSPTNVGKTLIMCSLATNCMNNGYKVLYVTFEDSELKIGARVMQNLCDVSQNQLRLMSDNEYEKTQKKFENLVKGRLIIKEYPEDTKNAMNIKSLLKDLKMKIKFEPDIIFIDYIGCMIPNGRNDNWNTNTTLAKVSSQVRAISQEFGMPIISGAQTNRGGLDNEEFSLSNVADSYGSVMKADFILGVSQTQEMQEQHLYMFDVKKTRFGGNKNDSKPVSVDVEKQRVFDFNTNPLSNRFKNVAAAAVAADENDSSSVNNIEIPVNIMNNTSKAPQVDSDWVISDEEFEAFENKYATKEERTYTKKTEPKQTVKSAVLSKSKNIMEKTLIADWE